MFIRLKADEYKWMMQFSDFYFEKNLFFSAFRILHRFVNLWNSIPIIYIIVFGCEQFQKVGILQHCESDLLSP